mmetsp:Transcript_62479/g.85859  ORF Transcript_62479/g.85859 Transcript_62479/m.85859 type:complete len:157 (-) Transcript_62479:595-1065(-)
MIRGISLSRRTGVANTRLFSDAPQRRIKHKIPQKKASSLMNELRQEQKQSMGPIPPFRSGDALEITLLPYKTAPEPEVIRGVVLSKVNKGNESNCILRDVSLGEIIERRVKIHSPLIQDIKILERAFIHKGDKRVRRAKLYYLRDRDPLVCKVSKR